MTTNAKYLPAASFKFVGEGSAIEGYASIFGEKDLTGDVVTAGAFTKSITEIQQSGHRLPMLWAHRQEDTVGSWVELRQDGVGLYVRGVINAEVERGREALALVKGGDLSGLSIGYLVPSGGSTVKGSTAFLTEVRLLEISLVAVPAAPSARIVLKDLRDLNEFADFLRSVGVSRREAEFVARKSWPAISQTSPEIDLEAICKRIDAHRSALAKFR